MPLVRIDLRRGQPASYRRSIARSVHRALVETVDVPQAGRFQVIAQLTEVDQANWSFGHAEARYVPKGRSEDQR
ncbi:MAG TPA: tautomerase family protein [Candidatus Limnocylindria bacterium]|nr:tautomerase family protein [Candidatus Limnocylindria bacterium]